jgi:hypothetical protein
MGLISFAAQFPDVDKKAGTEGVILSMGGERLDSRNPTSKLMLTILAESSPGNVRSCSNASARVSPSEADGNMIRGF